MPQPNITPAATNAIHKPKAGHNNHRASLTLVSIAAARATAGAAGRARSVRDDKVADIGDPSFSGLLRESWVSDAANSIEPRYGAYLRMSRPACRQPEPGSPFVRAVLSGHCHAQ